MPAAALISSPRPSWLLDEMAPRAVAAAVADALRVAAPDLAGLPVMIPSPADRDDPVWQMSSAALGEDYIVKFAWSRAAARFVLHQIRILETLAIGRRSPTCPRLSPQGPAR